MEDRYTIFFNTYHRSQVIFYILLGTNHFNSTFSEATPLNVRVKCMFVSRGCRKKEILNDPLIPAFSTPLCAIVVVCSWLIMTCRS